MDSSEIYRKKMALELGLPENSTWGDISNFYSEIDRKKRALELGLPENSTWGDISNFYSGNTKIDMNIDVNTYKRSNFEITTTANKKPKNVVSIVKEGLINRGKRKIE